jgi:hypothetical protein
LGNLGLSAAEFLSAPVPAATGFADAPVLRSTTHQALRIRQPFNDRIQSAFVFVGRTTHYSITFLILATVFDFAGHPEFKKLANCFYLQHNKKLCPMWSTETLWFEVAVVSIIYASGNILFGQFEERNTKVETDGQVYHYAGDNNNAFVLLRAALVAMLLLAAFLPPLLYIHGYYLPKKKGHKWMDWRAEE